jgi:hypothetical protein
MKEEAFMTEQERIEQEVRDVLAMETQAIPLSDKLFSPAGLFNQFAKTVKDRVAVVRSALFKQAQARFRELQHREAEAFSQALQRKPAALPAGDYVIKIERAETV